MNFFEQQHRARRRSTLLVLLFSLAVLGIVIATNLVVLGAVVIYAVLISREQEKTSAALQEAKKEKKAAEDAREPMLGAVPERVVERRRDDRPEFDPGLGLDEASVADLERYAHRIARPGLERRGEAHADRFHGFPSGPEPL